MVRIDKNADLFPEGWHFFEVFGCESKFTQKGDEQFVVRMKDVDTGRLHSERWFVSGQWVSMSVGKLKALGLDLDNDIQPIDLVGRRFYANVKHKEGKGDFGPQAQITKAFPEDKPPKEYTSNPVVPFDGKGDDAVTADGEMPW